MSSQLIPLALLVILAYAVSSAFLGVYQLAIETILICFCEDRSSRKGTPVSDTTNTVCFRHLVSATAACTKRTVVFPSVAHRRRDRLAQVLRACACNKPVHACVCERMKKACLCVLACAHASSTRCRKSRTLCRII